MHAKILITLSKPPYLRDRKRERERERERARGTKERRKWGRVWREGRREEWIDR